MKTFLVTTFPYATAGQEPTEVEAEYFVVDDSGALIFYTKIGTTGMNKISRAFSPYSWQTVEEKEESE